MAPTADRPHSRRRFLGRDPDEDHRASTPLELLFDLTIVVAYGTAAEQLAHYVAEGHAAAGIGGFLIGAFAVSWAWLNYTWFASAYDTDDWVFRLATMVQMVGVIVNSLGLAPLFASLDHGHAVDVRVLVAGYVIMRVALVFLWWQVARQDRARRAAARSYIVTVSAAQVGWVAVGIVEPTVVPFLVAFAALLGVELAGPYVAERKVATPWHPEHIAERYGLLVIITLGEVLIGTVASLNAVVHGATGWSLDAALLAVAGVGLAFGCWWMYFSVPWAAPITRRRERAFPFGYGHLALFAALAAMGGGLQVAALRLDGEASVGAVATVLAVAVPLAVFAGLFYLLYSVVMGTFDPPHVVLLAGTAALLVLAVVLAAAGASVAVCLLVLTLAPIVTIVGYETFGHRHMAAVLDEL